jgi:SAM-dependent methyltransferase
MNTVHGVNIEDKMSNLEKTKQYFEKNPEHLKHAKEAYILLYENSGKKISPHISGTVLDIGSGGIINYNSAKAEKLVLIDISVANKENAVKNIFFVNSNVKQLGLKRGIANSIIIQHVLHHLAEDTRKKSEESLANSIHEISSALKKGGKLIIIEGVVPYSLEIIQKILFPLNKILYQILFNFPMVLQYSQKTIIKQVQQHGLNIESIELIDDGNVLPIFGMNLPRKYIPLKHLCIIARKE